MIRKPFRDLERDLEDLENATSPGEEILFAHRDPRTGELATDDGEPVDPDDHEADLLIVVEQSVVMERERAEAAGIEILGPAKDVPDGRDIVRVPPDAYRNVDRGDS